MVQPIAIPHSQTSKIRIPYREKRRRLLYTKKIAYLLPAAFGALYMTANAASGPSTPGVTAKQIKIGMFAPLSGPDRSYGQDVVNAAKMYYKQVNANGGIDGRKIKIFVADTRCNANQLLADAKKLVDDDHVFLLNGGSCSSAVMAAKQYVLRNKIPLVMLNASGDGALFPPTKYIFGAFSISQHAEGGSLVQFAVKALHAKTIGYINEKDAYGQWNYDAASFQASKDNATLIKHSLSPTDTDVTPAVLALRARNTDAIIVTTYARQTALITRKLHNLGYQNPVVLSVNGTANLANMVKDAGGPSAFSNVYIESLLLAQRDSPKLAWVYKMYRQTYPKLAREPGHPQLYMPFGIPSAMAVVRALRAAGADLTRARFVSAMESEDFNSRVMAGPIKFGPHRRDAQRASIYFRFNGHKESRVPGTYLSDWHFAN